MDHEMVCVDEELTETVELGECPSEYQQAEQEPGGSHCGESPTYGIVGWDLRQAQVGNEFSQVEGLWSQFENVMAKQPERDENNETKEEAASESA
jgi:hypothetical protein